MGLNNTPVAPEFDVVEDTAGGDTPWAAVQDGRVLARFASRDMAMACVDALESVRDSAEGPPPGDGWTLIQTKGFTRLVGPIWFRGAGAEQVYGFRALPKHRNRNGIIHGGMLMTFIDRILGMATAEQSDAQPQATIQLDTHFISPVTVGEFVEARCVLLRRTKSVAFVSATVSVGERLVAKSQGIWKLRESPP